MNTIYVVYGSSNALELWVLKTVATAKELRAARAKDRTLLFELLNIDGKPGDNLIFTDKLLVEENPNLLEQFEAGLVKKRLMGDA